MTQKPSKPKLHLLKSKHMKQALIKILDIVKSQLTLYVFLVFCLFLPNALKAQADTTKQTETVVAEAPTLLSPSMEFFSVQHPDGSFDLKAALKTKVKGASIKLPYLKVSFKLVSDTVEKELGFIITDGQGKAVYSCKPNSINPDKEGKFNFKAVFAGNKSMDPAEAEVTVKKARLEMTPVKEDSLLTVKVKLTDLGTGTETPVDKTTIGIYVKRHFLPLKLGEGTTDETGEASIEIPANLPGDTKGNLTLFARVDEHEIYGNMESAVVQQWGVPVSDQLQKQPRALWSAHPPIWMLVTFIILMGTVWGHYIVIVFELFRLRKEEPNRGAITKT